MNAETWGSGPRVLLVHGAITNGPAAWSKQKPLADRWQLVVVNRPGFVPNPPVGRCDFETDGRSIAEMLDEPTHLVGHSYGGLVVLLAASFRPGAVRSLVVIEPAVMSLMRGDPEVEGAIAAHVALVASHRDDPQAFLAAFTANLGGDSENVPRPLPEQLRQHVELLISERYPWEATVPSETVSGTPYPSWWCPSAARLVIEGAGHVVQRTGAPFNTALDQFLSRAS